MAQQENPVNREMVSCSVCLDVLKEPVTLNCGHSYCMGCIENHWDSQAGRNQFSCPQCMTTFTLRPQLKKNVMFADIVEQLKKTDLQASPADRCYAGAEDVACDVCMDRKLRAAKSCLDCRASYCKKHLQLHFRSPVFMKHKLVEPREKLQENICPAHNEVMTMFCRTDQQCICYLCPVDVHQGHDTVSVAAERAVRQRELGARRDKVQQRTQDREEDMKVLQPEVEAINTSADKAVEHIKEILAELIHLLQQRVSDVEQQIRSQQEGEVSRVKELQEDLEHELCELRRTDAELQRLENTQDHAHFLHSYCSLPTLGESAHTSFISNLPPRYFEDVTAAMSKVRVQTHDILNEASTNILGLLSREEVLLPQPRPEPETRAGFLKLSLDVTADPNTADNRLILSEGNRKLKWGKQKQIYPDHPHRFTYTSQVLSRESLTECCYWEVKWSGGTVFVGVSYKNIIRTGSGESRLGFNDKSWSLECNENETYKFKHNKTTTPVWGPRSSRVGVYLDHSAGVLSFYNIADTMTLLHKFQTMFTQPLYAGLWLGNGTQAEFCKPRRLVNLKKHFTFK